MENIIPISLLQSQAKRYVDQVKKTEKPIIVTQRGKAAAVLVDYESYEGFLATQSEMRFADWPKRLLRAEKELRKGTGATLESYRKKRQRPH